MAELDVNLPSTRQTQSLIKDKIEVEVKVSTNDVFIGIIAWQDPDCLFLIDGDDQKILIYRYAIVYIKPRG
jgi:host factor-I protein